jgi:hypothetical protein
VDQAGQQIATELIGAEPVRAVHGDEAFAQARLGEAVGRDQIGAHRGGQHDQHDGGTRGAERLAPHHLHPDVEIPRPAARRCRPLRQRRGDRRRGDAHQRYRMRGSRNA